MKLRWELIRLDSIFYLWSTVVPVFAFVLTKNASCYPGDTP